MEANQPNKYQEQKQTNAHAADVQDPITANYTINRVKYRGKWICHLTCQIS